MDKRTFNDTEKINGELAIRCLSKDAYNYYSGTEPLRVYERDTNYGKRYYVRGVDNADNLTFNQLDNMFCELGRQNGECL